MSDVGSNRSDDEIDSLLAERRFPGPTKDRVFEAAVAATASGRRARSLRARGLSLAAGFIAVAAAALLFVRGSRRDDGDGFRAKGAASVIELDVDCVGAAGASLAACPVGARLVFSVGGNTAGGYLAAYAEPRSGGQRIWFFSGEGDSPPLPATASGRSGSESGPIVLDKAIPVGAEFPLGEYRVMLYATRQPMTRAQVSSAAAGGAKDVLAHREAAVRIVPAGGGR